jgi:hypothetical protein
MGSKQFELGPNREMDQRRAQAAEFYEAALDPEEQPFFVSDEATPYDIYAGDERKLIERCKQHYGIELRREHFSLPIWQLLDHLARNRTE